MPLVPVVAMAEYRLGDQLHRRLRGYKDAPVCDARLRYQDQLCSLAARWLHDHGPTLPVRFGTGWDAVVAVPSSSRPAGAPAETLLRRIPGVGGSLEHLLVRGSAPTGHLRADRLGFALAPGTDRGRLRSLRILVFDDSVVTGARAQSAAAALRLAGSPVAGVLAIGRAVGPDRSGGSSSIG
jgi:predicted amidophosphoribosyltransferase